MYGWQRYLSIEHEFKKAEQYIPYELEDVYSEFFTRQVILLGAEIEASFKKVCNNIEPSESCGNIGQIKGIILKHYPGIISWKCTVKGTEKEIIPFQGWDQGVLEWWGVYTDIKHNLVDRAATYKIALKMLGAYEQLLLIATSTDPNRADTTDKAIGGNLLNEAVDGGKFKAYTILEMPELLVPDIEFGIGDGISGLPGIAFYPENVLNKINTKIKKKDLSKKNYINLDNKTILVTGSPGFIGANLVIRLLKEMKFGTVISLDNMNDYYEVELKEYRLKLIEDVAEKNEVKHIFIKGDISDKGTVDKVFEDYQPSIVVNLAAQAGVRYSIDHPNVYIESNITGFYNILEACRHSYDHAADGASDGYEGVEHLVYASSSSVYGGNKKVPFSTDDKVDNPVSLYAATKKSDELLAHAYSKLYNIPCTGLRFFTVYGPAGRPDMFYYSATNTLVKGENIRLFNHGNMKRDFTYIDDIVEGVLRVMQGAPEKSTGDDGLPVPPYALYNIGGGQPENLLNSVNTLQEELVRAGVLGSGYDFDSHREFVPMQAGDVPITYADSSDLERDYGFKPEIGIRDGLRQFCNWYKEYYGSSEASEG